MVVMATSVVVMVTSVVVMVTSLVVMVGGSLHGFRDGNQGNLENRDSLVEALFCPFLRLSMRVSDMIYTYIPRFY